MPERASSPGSPLVPCRVEFVDFAWRRRGSAAPGVQPPRERDWPRPLRGPDVARRARAAGRRNRDSWRDLAVRPLHACAGQRPAVPVPSGTPGRHPKLLDGPVDRIKRHAGSRAQMARASRRGAERAGDRIPGDGQRGDRQAAAAAAARCAARGRLRAGNHGGRGDRLVTGYLAGRTRPHADLAGGARCRHLHRGPRLRRHRASQCARHRPRRAIHRGGSHRVVTPTRDRAAHAADRPAAVHDHLAGGGRGAIRVPP